MSGFRRSLMMAAIQDHFVWDYEWYPPDEKPSWFTVTNSNVTTEVGSNYFRLYCASLPANAPNRLLYSFLASEFPNTESYLVEIDMLDNASRYATSAAGGICYSKLTGANGIWVKRNGNGKVSGKDYYRALLASGNNSYDGPLITDELRYTLRLLYDNTNGIFKASVGDKEFSISATNIAPREVYSRYTNNNTIDIYSIKIKVL